MNITPAHAHASTHLLLYFGFVPKANYVCSTNRIEYLLISLCYRMKNVLFSQSGQTLQSISRYPIYRYSRCIYATILIFSLFCECARARVYVIKLVLRGRVPYTYRHIYSHIIHLCFTYYRIYIL